MFEVVSTSGRQLIQGLADAPLTDHYAYLRMFFGRLLADVRVETEAGGFRLAWLIPEGVGAIPPPERVQRELAASGWNLERARQELRGGEGGPRLVRRSMAARVLAALRLPASADDVRFTQSGDLMFINWCVDDSAPKVGDCDPRLVVNRLAEIFRVPAPAIAPPPPGPVRQMSLGAPSSPSGRDQAGGAVGVGEGRGRQEPTMASSGQGAQRGYRGLKWALVIAGCVFLLIVGLAFGAILVSVVLRPDGTGKPPTPKAGDGERPATNSDRSAPAYWEGYEDGQKVGRKEVYSSIETGADWRQAEAHRLVRHELDKDRLTYWVPLKQGTPLYDSLSNLGTVTTPGGVPMDGRWWLVWDGHLPSTTRSSVHQIGIKDSMKSIDDWETYQP